MASPSTGNGTEPTMYEKQLSNAPSIGYTAQARRLGDVYESDARLDRSHPAAAVDTGNIQDAHWRRCEGQQSWPLMSWSLPSQGDPEYEDVEVEGYKVSLRAMPMGERQQTAPGRTADEHMMYKNWEPKRVEQQQRDDVMEPDGDQDKALVIQRRDMTNAQTLRQKMTKKDSGPLDMSEYGITNHDTSSQQRRTLADVVNQYDPGKTVTFLSSVAEGMKSSTNQGRTSTNNKKQDELPSLPLGNCEMNTTANVNAEIDRQVALEVKRITTVERIANVSARYSSPENIRRLEEVKNYEQRWQSNGSDHGHLKRKSDTEVRKEVQRQLISTDASGNENGTVTTEPTKVSPEEVHKTIRLREGTGLDATYHVGTSDIPVLAETKKPMLQSGFDIANSQAPHGEENKLEALAETIGTFTNSQSQPANEPRVDTQKDSATPLSYQNRILQSNVSGVERSDRLTTVQKSKSDAIKQRDPTSTGAQQSFQYLNTSERRSSKEVVSIRVVEDTFKVQSTRLTASSDKKPKARVRSGTTLMSG